MAYSVIIPSRNIDNLRVCVASLASEHPERIVVCWDCSIFPPPTELFDSPVSSNISFIDPPFIYAKSINRGIIWCDDTDVLLLNDDTILEHPGSLDKLAECANQHPEFGIISPTINGTIGNFEQKRQTRGIDLREATDRLCFVSVFIRRKVIEDIGLLDERFVGYGFDDDDYCKRVKAKGYKLGVFEGCSFEHDSLPSTFRTATPEIHELVAKNKQLFTEKYA